MGWLLGPLCALSWAGSYPKLEVSRPYFSRMRVLQASVRACPLSIGEAASLHQQSFDQISEIEPPLLKC